MPHSLHVGSHVWADFGDGFIIAHIASLAHTNDDGETKFGIQALNGHVVDMAYREPPYGTEGSGLCFKKI
jgi:hypothetical protein